MTKLFARFVQTILIGVLLCLVAGSIVSAQGLSLSCTPGTATTNSVWNFTAVWKDAYPLYRWPSGMPTSPEDGLLIYNVQSQAPVYASNVMDEPYFMGFNELDYTKTAGEHYDAISYATLQPNPDDIKTEFAGLDARFDHGLDLVAGEASMDKTAITVADPTPSIMPGGLGGLTPAFFDAQPARDDDGDDTNGDQSRPDIPPVVVPAKVPVWLVGVWTDSTKTIPVKAQIVKADTLYDKWPKVNVIQILDTNITKAMKNLYYEYYCPGTHYIVTEQAPVAAPYTVYKIPLITSHHTLIKINDSILRFNSHKTDPNDYIPDPASGISVPGPNSPLLGVYDNADLKGINYFDPIKGGQYMPPGAQSPYYGVINLTGKPKDGWPAGTKYLYVKVSVQGIESVAKASDKKELYYSATGVPGAYDWMKGLIKLQRPDLIGNPDFEDLGKAPDGTEFGSVYLMGQPVIVQYRKLSTTTFTVGQPELTSLSNVQPVPAGKYKFTNTDGFETFPNGMVFLSGSNVLPDGAYAAKLTYYRMDPEYGTPGVVWLYAGGQPIPMMYDSGDPWSGAVYKAVVSAGLNMSNTKQWPSIDPLENIPTGFNHLNNLIWGPVLTSGIQLQMYYAKGIRGDAGTAPMDIGASAFIPAGGGQAVKVWDAKTTITVRGSRVRKWWYNGDWSYSDGQGLGEPEMIDYGGTTVYSTAQGGDHDYLTCYPENGSASWPAGYDVDPLSVEPIEEANPTNPDDGSSSTQFVFRVRYHNQVGLPPLPWLDDDCAGGSPSGVVLYLDESGTGDYRPYFMHPEDLAKTGDGAVYMFRFLPHQTIGSVSSPSGLFPVPWMQWQYKPGTYYTDDFTYQSLCIGTYHYFFACSDDSLKFFDGHYPFEDQFQGNQFGFGSYDDMYDWGELPESWINRRSTGLDPTISRRVENYPDVNRNAHRRYSSTGDLSGYLFDSTIYVDRPVRVPGVAEQGLEHGLGFSYPWKADAHPKITCSLSMYRYDLDSLYHTGSPCDDLFIRYDDIKYGLGRFYGTIDPYYRAVNPELPGAHTQFNLASLAETCGATSKTDNVFRIYYQQMDNQPPNSIRVWINNASEKTGSDAAHQYTAYAMYPRANQTTPYNYRKGVWYEYKMKLPPGPHTYYFDAYDGEHVARFPVRPDKYPYAVPPGTGYYIDWWVPTESLASERANATYVDNDYFPGPFVNHPCVVSDVSVTPGTGKEGQGFRYRAKYSDPDGQRVYSAYITIEVNDRGDTRTFQMIPEKPIYDPTIDHSQEYKDGVYYYLDTATIKDFAMQKGVRRYYIEFTDDWGRQHDVNDIIKGETTRYPEGGGNWVSGPIISGNYAPTLSYGSIESQDGTANAATLWTFRVKYRDLNNDEPKLIKLYLGLIQPDGKTILWDDGHTMLPADASDKVYSDGCDYYFQSRLGAAQALAEGEEDPKQYYYAFEAYDGVDWASYKSSSNDEQRSNAAGCFVLQDLERVEADAKYPNRQYKFHPVVVQQGHANGLNEVIPANAVDIVKVNGVYLNEDMTGTNYYDPSAGNFLPSDASIQLTTPLPAGSDVVYVQYEAQAPIVGPLPVDQPAPAGVIPDAIVYENYNQNPNPVLVDDQKNGWISEADPANDHAIVSTNGLATYLGNPTRSFVTLNNPKYVASVEGVYLTPYLDGDIPADYPIQDKTNYYDPAALTQPLVQPGTVQYQIMNYMYEYVAVPSDLNRFSAGVLGVYDNPDCTGTNYYQGEQNYRTWGATSGYEDKWQEAVGVDVDKVWPTNPYDILNITGVYVKWDATGPTYFGNGTTPLEPYQGALYPVGPAPMGEYIILDNPVPTDAVTGLFPLTTYVKYRGIGPSVDYPYWVKLATNPGLSTPIYIKTRPKGFSAGDTAFRLTQDLPEETMDAVTSAPYVVTPTNPEVIGQVLSVYDNNDPNHTNLYAATTNPFRSGDTTIRITTTSSGPFTVTYVPLKRQVYVKYSDMRYTHQLRGTSVKPSAWVNSMEYMSVNWVYGNTHYLPDGYDVPNVHIKGNVDDIYSGIVGVWLNSQRDGANLFDPLRTSQITNDHWMPNLAGTYTRTNGDAVRLSKTAPDGTNFLWANFYQRGDYHIDRWNRDVVFLQEKDPANRYQASYFFGTKMPFTLKANKAPTLRDGKVSPLYGARAASYVYTVTYEDQDGEHGQKPTYVRVYIDNVPYDMTPVNTGTPAYNEGAIYTFTPPSGLSGAAHKFHFEASDGAAVAWFDANKGHQSLLGSVDTYVKEIDGPWVNNPPTLSAGAVSPNPATGGIATYQSVDYSVTYTDLDNEPPYFYDPVTDLDLSGKPVGQDVSDSPRVWIDSAQGDDAKAETLYKVSNLEDDPLEPGKKRVIVVTNLDGNTPTWGTDQFAGKLMQVTNGEIIRRVYLIQSNSANKLVVATDDLAKDGVKTSISGTPTQFRINGLVMSKADPTKQDFTAGVVYTLTVPKLTAINHKFHFTARSRETKPQWLISQLVAANLKAYPYSGPARFPMNGELNGPNVISVPPPGNVAPTITNSVDTSLYAGPKVQAVTVQAANQVGATNAATFAQIREVLGVYLNANLTGTNYYDPKTTATPFTEGDASIKLSPSIAAVSDTDELVQLGRANNSLLSVIPDSANAIGTVLGVYTDQSLSGTNYYDTSIPTVEPFVPGDTAIKLTSPLPSSSSVVYVKYNLKNGVNWPPVYVNYYGKHTSSSLFLQGDPLTFKIDYSDPDNDAPAYHNSVQGYVRVYFDNVTVGNPMFLRYPPVTDYTVDTPFVTTLTNISGGRHTYHFEASDGYRNVRWPLSASGNPAANDYSLTVNYKPVLSSSDVYPATGKSDTPFAFKVRYTDTDGDGTGKPVPEVKLRLVTHDANGKPVEHTYSMTASGGAPKFSTGVDYTYTTTSNLDPGTYQVMFEGFDGYQQSDPQPASDNPMTIVVRTDNNAPQIISYSVDPPAGKTGSMFTYKAKYRDIDGLVGDAPIADISGTRVEGLKLYLDGDKTHPILMVRDKSIPLPLGGYTNAAGVEYTALVSGKTLGVGTHSFTVSASDGTANAEFVGVPDTKSGPVLLVPYFENLRVVDVAAADPKTAAGVSNAVVGQQVIVAGKMRFPNNTITGTPAAITNAVVKVTKPDNSTVTLAGGVSGIALDPTKQYWEGDFSVNSYPSYGDPALVTGNSLTLCATGEWKVSAAWAGDAKWDKAETGTNSEGSNHLADVMVGGPIRTIPVDNPANPEQSAPTLDMITVPMIIGSTDIGQVLGYDRAIQCLIARWSASSNSYFRYGLPGQFPALQPGEAIWIKPKTTYPAAETVYAADADMGTLMFANSEARGLDPNCSKKYRLIKPLVKAYPKVGQTLSPSVINLKTGWNQIGNIFFNWRKDAQGNIIEPREDVGIPLSDVKVRYLNQEKSLEEAKVAGWIRNYAWRFDASKQDYVLVHPTNAGAERTLRAWYGYWIKSLVDCQLVINPNTSYNGVIVGASANLAREAAAVSKIDAPPAVPDK